MTNPPRSHSYQLFMLALCIFAIGTLAIHSLFSLSDSTKQILEYADTGICGLFLLDFAHSLLVAEKPLRYLYTWGWLDLLSSIPAIPVLRLGRAGRLIRIVRVLRGFRATKVLTGFVLDRRAESAALAAGLLSLLLLVFSSIAILQFESDPASNIKTGGDALWWALTTVTTVGYGDRYPVTPEGRLVAAILMIAGVALYGIVSGFVAAWFLAPSSRAQRTELEDVREELRDLNLRLEQVLKRPSQ